MKSNVWAGHCTVSLLCSVSGYAGDPASFLHRRVLALYTYIVYGWMHILYPRPGVYPVDWRSGRLTASWGSHNRRAAHRYKQLVDSCQS